MNIDGIQAIAEGSKTITTYSLTILGGSLLALISNSYSKPNDKYVKLMYLIFIVGWCFLASAIYYGDQLSRRAIIAALKPEMILDCEAKMNTDFLHQLDNFNYALITFGMWLLCYVRWWTLKDFVFKSK